MKSLRINLTHEKCIQCGKPTVPLFAQERFCPFCEGDAPKENPKAMMDGSVAQRWAQTNPKDGHENAYKGTMPCMVCTGFGMVHANSAKLTRCPNCKGFGYVRIQ